MRQIVGSLARLEARTGARVNALAPPSIHFLCSMRSSAAGCVSSSKCVIPIPRAHRRKQAMSAWNGARALTYDEHGWSLCVCVLAISTVCSLLLFSVCRAKELVVGSLQLRELSSEPIYVRRASTLACVCACLCMCVCIGIKTRMHLHWHAQFFSRSYRA